MNENLFIQLLQEKGIQLSDFQINQFKQYYSLLIEWNQKMNLTAITDRDEVYLKHFFDSLTSTFYYDFNQSLNVCDVGAGAGFPSLPIKIAFPHLRVTIVDSLNKRIQFLNHLANELQLTDVHFYHDRAETFGQSSLHRENYDVVMARAVARLSVLSEFCLPLVKVNGTFIAMKGANAKEEIDSGKRAIHTLGGAIDYIHSFQLPIEESERNIVIIKKKNSTPKKYPRKPGMPVKSPLE